MTTKTLTVTLSRAHKIAERIKALWNAAYAEADKCASPVRFQSRPSESTLTLTANAGQTLFEAAQRAQRYALAWSSVRQAIAVENRRRGIDEKLLKLEIERKNRALWAKAYETSIGTGYLPEEAGTYQPEASRFGVFDMTVNALRTPSVAASIKKTHESHERSWVFLQDAVNEANAATVSFVLDIDIADAVTGAALEVSR